MVQRNCILYFHPKEKGHVVMVDPVSKKVVWKGNTYDIPREGQTWGYIDDPLDNGDIEFENKLA